jgi:CRISPR/Cas system CSM-associated protein Csm2 small subunit
MLRTLAMLGTFGLATVAMTVGCDDSATTERADNAQERAQRDAEALKESAQAAGTSVGGEAQRQAEKAAEKAEDVAADANKAVNDQAKSLYDKIETAIRERRWEEAEKLVDQLEALKSNLSPEWQARVEQARSMLDNAKKAANPGN